MDISIIIVNFNTDKLVSDCIASIKRNTKKVTYETIVIDNTINNRGFAKANNLGIRKAKGKYILLLNSDTIVGKNSIDKMFEFAENNPDAGAIVPRLYNPNGSIQASCFRLPTIHLAFKQYFLKQGKLLDKYFPRSEKPTIVESAVMAAYLITPEALKKVGKLNEKYFMYFEDIDYSKKINEAGLKIYYLPEAQVVHIHGASGGTNKYLVDSAKKYFGTFNYYIYTFILWLGQKWGKTK